jgi:hypothetical protein
MPLKGSVRREKNVHPTIGETTGRKILAILLIQFAVLGVDIQLAHYFFSFFNM